MGVILVGVSVGAALDRLLSPHPVWPFSVTILLGVVAMVGGVLWALGVRYKPKPHPTHVTHNYYYGFPQGPLDRSESAAGPSASRGTWHDR